MDASSDAEAARVQRAWKWHHFNPPWLPSHLALVIRMAMLRGTHRPVVCRLDTGQKFFAYPDDLIQCTICVNGEWEGLIYRSVRRFVPPGGVILDVGAHVGYSSVLFADWVGEAGSVHAFEPLDWHREQIERNLELNRLRSRVKLHPIAVAEKQGTAAFYYRRSMNTGIGSLYARSRSSRVLKVRTAPLDAWRQEVGVASASLVKIDVEGAELSVLDGMEDGLAQGAYPLLLVELHPTQLQAIGHSATEVVERLVAHGYSIETWTENHRFEPYPRASLTEYILARR